MSAEENSSIPPEPPEPSEPAPYTSESRHGIFEPGGSALEPARLQRHSKWFAPENFNVPWGWLDVAMLVPIAIALLFIFALMIIGCEIAFVHAQAGYLRAHM